MHGLSMQEIRALDLLFIATVLSPILSAINMMLLRFSRRALGIIGVLSIAVAGGLAVMFLRAFPDMIQTGQVPWEGLLVHNGPLAITGMMAVLLARGMDPSDQLEREKSEKRRSFSANNS